MPQYLNSLGQTVSASEATFDGKRTRPGYSAVVADGERVRMQPGDYLGFNIDMVDRQPTASSVFLNDAAGNPILTSDEAGVIVAKARLSHDRKNAYLGDRAPAFTDAMAHNAVAREVQSRQATAAFSSQYAADTAALQVKRDAERVAAHDSLKRARQNRYR